MKTFTAPMQPKRNLQTATDTGLLLTVAASFREILAVVSAIVAAVAIIMLSVWVAGQQVTEIISAATWGAGFIFLALAIDNRGPTALLQLFSGVSLAVLAWLQNSSSMDYTIMSGSLIATWVAVSLFKRLR